MYSPTTLIIKTLEIIFMVHMGKSAAETITFLCTLYGDAKETPELLYEGYINVTYDRNNLFVYGYNNTNYTNFLVKDAKIGIFESDTGFSWNLDTDIEGLSTRYKLSNNKYWLTQTTLDFTKNLKNKYNPYLDKKSLQEKLTASFFMCNRIPIYEQVANPEEADYARARYINHDFGNYSVMYKLYHEKYPSLMVTGADGVLGRKNLDKPELQISLNFLADFILSSLSTKLSKNEIGKIKGIPEIKQGSLTMTDISFGDFRTFKRVADVNITSSGLHYVVETEYELSKAIVNAAFEVSAFHKFKGFIEINLSGIKCGVRASISYNVYPCLIELTDVHMSLSHEPSFSFSGLGRIEEKALRYFGENRMKEEILKQITQIIPHSIKGGMNEFLSVNMNCEIFRP